MAGQRTLHARLGLRLAGPILLCLAWEGFYRLEVIDPILFSSPLEIAKNLPALVSGGIFQFPDPLARHLVVSLKDAATGFALGVFGGNLLGILIGTSRTAHLLLYVPVEICRALPPIALLPLTLFWFGIGWTSKVALITFNCTIPTLLSTSAAILALDRSLLIAARSYGPSGWQVLTKVLLPAALPGMLAGMRLSLASAFTILVAAEMIGANAGIGWLLLRAWRYMEVQMMFVGIISVSILSLSLDGVIRLVGSHFLRWQRGAVLGAREQE